MNKLRATWEYVSNNRLLVALLLFAITSASAIGLALKRTNHWFWTDADISHGGALIASLAIAGELVVIVLLSIALRRATRASARQPEVRPEEKPKVEPQETEGVPATFDLTSEIRLASLSCLLASYPAWISLDALRLRLRATGVLLPHASKAQIAREMDAAESAHIVTSDVIHGYCLTQQGRDWMLDRAATSE